MFLSLRNIVAYRVDEGVIGGLHSVANQIYTNVSPTVLPIFILVILSVFILRWKGKNDRILMDFLGAVLVFRTIAGFAALNLMIVNPVKDNSLLLRQFLCFMPALIIGWGWIYWRLDQGARMKGRQLLLFPEDEHQDDIKRDDLCAFDYYYHSAMVAFIFELSKVEPLSKSMKLLFLINAAMMLDLVGLVLTQAIGLAGGG